MLGSAVLLKTRIKVHKTHVSGLSMLCIRNNVLAMLYRRLYEVLFQGNFANNDAYS